MVYLYESPEELLQVYAEYIQAQKAEGKKCIAFFAHEFVPQELIRAAGAIPVPLILAGDEERTTMGSDYLTPTMCPYALSLIGAFKEKENQSKFGYLKQIDAIISTNYCAADTIVNEWIADLNELRRYKLHIPFLREDHHQAYFLTELQKLGKDLEELTGKTISPDVLIKEIQDARAFRKVLIELAKTSISGPVKNKIYQQAILFGPKGHPEFTLEKLEAFLAETNPKLAQNQPKKKVILAGASTFIGDNLTEFIEECGGTVIADATWLGLNWVLQDTHSSMKLLEDQPTLQNALVYLTHRFATANPTLHCAPNTVESYVEEIQRYAKKFGVNAVIYHILKFCDLVGHHRGAIKDRLAKLGIQVLLLERDYSSAVTGQIRTRIEAFFEMIN